MINSVRYTELIGTLREKTNCWIQQWVHDNENSLNCPKRAMGGGRAKTSNVDCRNAAYTISTVGELSRIGIFNKYLLGTSEKSFTIVYHLCSISLLPAYSMSLRNLASASIITETSLESTSLICLDHMLCGSLPTPLISSLSSVLF